MKKFNELSQVELDVLLLDACTNDDLEQVVYLLESPELTRHASIDANPYDTYDSPIRSATEVGSLEIVKYLMTKNVHSQDFHIALGCACERGELEIVKFFLLEHGDRVNINDYIYPLGATPLSSAFSNFQIEVIDFLLNSSELKENSKLITRNEDMQEDDAFYSASYSGSEQIIELVMNCEQFRSYPEQKKIKALENTFWNEKIESIEYFIKHKDFDFISEYENVFLKACQTHNLENIRYFNQFYDFKESDNAWESILKNEDINPDFIQYLIIEKNWKSDIGVMKNLEQEAIKDLIQSLTKSKELNKNLEYNLEVKRTNSKKLKI